MTSPIFSSSSGGARLKGNRPWAQGEVSVLHQSLIFMLNVVENRVVASGPLDFAQSGER